MQKSESVNDLFAAISKAMGEFTSVTFDKVNPFFNNSKYASLSATQEMYRPILAKHGLALIQSITVEGEDYFLETALLHSSGQFLSDRLKLLVDKKSMQGLGSAITYAKRYAAQSLLGICGDDDDDGNAASGKEPQKKNPVDQVKEQVQKLVDKKVNTPLPRPVPGGIVNNFAPANASQLGLITTLLDQRSIPAGDLDFLVTEGYGVKPENLPTWVAKEIIQLLGDQNTNQGTIIEKTTEVRARRLAKK